MNKEDNARMLDPMRFKIAKNMSVMPGGPETGNPMNVTDNSSPQITAPSIYGDYTQNYAQMGTAMVNPMGVQRSKLKQDQVPGQMLNANPFNAMQQPPAIAQDPMESARLDNEVRQRGLMANAMGLAGSPAVMPGAIPGSFQAGPPMMQGMMSAERPQNSMNPMTPGATKTTIKKKRA